MNRQDPYNIQALSIATLLVVLLALIMMTVGAVTQIWTWDTGNPWPIHIPLWPMGAFLASVWLGLFTSVRHMDKSDISLLGGPTFGITNLLLIGLIGKLATISFMIFIGTLIFGWVIVIKLSLWMLPTAIVVLVVIWIALYIITEFVRSPQIYGQI